MEFVVVNVAVVKPPLNAMVPAVFVKVTDPVFTAPEKVVPPEFVMVTVPISVPIAPEIVAAPEVFNVKLEAELSAVPVMELMLMGVATPVPTVNVTPFAKVTAPNVICPVDAPPTVAFAETLKLAVGVRVITPVPAAETVPAKLIVAGELTTTPPVNAKLSVASLPRVTIPVLENVVAPAIVPPAFKATL